MLSSAPKLSSILSCWLKCMEDYMSQLSSTPSPDNSRDKAPSLLTPPPPFSPLSPPVSAAVTNLITLCAELAIYSTDSEAERRCNLNGFIGQHAEVLNWSRVRCLLARQAWTAREEGWWALIRAGGEITGYWAMTLEVYCWFCNTF